MNNEQSAQHTVGDNWFEDNRKFSKWFANSGLSPFTTSYEDAYKKYLSAAGSQVSAEVKVSKWKCVNCGAECATWDEVCKNCTPKEEKEEWISVEDRLPDENRYVMVWCPSRVMAFMAVWRDFENGFDSPFEEIKEGITHWMPLPKKPSNI